MPLLKTSFYNLSFIILLLRSFYKDKKKSICFPNIIIYISVTIPVVAVTWMSVT
jgi:hypothetical protein